MLYYALLFLWDHPHMSWGNCKTFARLRLKARSQ